MRRWIAALLLLLVAGPLLLATACGGGGATRAGNGTPVPPGWNKHASPEGLTLTIPPRSGRVVGAVEFLGTISRELRSPGDKITIQLWPKGSFRDLGKVGESKYKGEVGASTQRVTITAISGYKGDKNDIVARDATETFIANSDSVFEGIIKLPHVIQDGDRLLLVEPGQHYLALILDDQHAVYAPFEIAPPPVLPTPSLAPYLSLGSFQFLDGKTGWLSASTCVNRPRATPDKYGNMPTQPSPICKSGFYSTTDGGQTWSLLSNNTIGEFQFDGPLVGLAVNSNTYCLHSPCPSTVVLTTNGGRQWTTVYETSERLSDLSIVGGEAWVVGDSCGYDDAQLSCTQHLLKSTDHGATWTQHGLPSPSLNRYGATISRPTKGDAFAGIGRGRESGELFATHDGGTTWIPSPLPASLFEGGVLFFRTPLEGWLLTGGVPGAGSQLKSLYATKDGGMSWTKIAESQLKTPEVGIGDLGTVGYVGPVLFTSDRDGWLALPRRGLVHSTDGGMHWTFVNVDQGQGEVQPIVQFTDTQHGWTVSRAPLPTPTGALGYLRRRGDVAEAAAAGAGESLRTELKLCPYGWLFPRPRCRPSWVYDLMVRRGACPEQCEGAQNDTGRR